MLRFVVDLALAPMLVAAATLAARRWGSRIGGLVSAFPAVVGPVLLITAQRMGPAAAARSAKGALLGLVALSGFVVVYGRLAGRGGWRLSLAGGWAVAGLLGLLASQGGGGGVLWAFAAAALSLTIARRALPPCAEAVRTGSHAGAGIWPRMAITALLVALLAGASRLLGPLAGGILASFPVLASVLAVFVHRDAGIGAVIPFLNGTVTGMLGFAGFCAVVAVLVVPAGIAPAFAAAVLTAAAAQAIAMHSGLGRRSATPLADPAA